MNKKLLILLLPILLSSCNVESGYLSSGETSSSEITSSSFSISSSGTLSRKEAPIYFAKYDEANKEYLTDERGKFTYLTDSLYGETRAFLSLNSFLSVFSEEKYSLTIKDDVWTYAFSGNMGTFSISKIGECTFSSLSSLSSLGLDYPLGFGDTSSNWHVSLTSASLNKGGEVTYSLSEYSLPYHLYEDDVYLLTSVISTLFLYGRLGSLVYNGKNFYFVSDPSSLQGGKFGGAFGESYYGDSSMIDEKSKPEEVATLDANSFLFTMDVCYGFIGEEKFIGGYGEYLKKEYPDIYSELYSTDVETVLYAYDKVVTSVMGDGHSLAYSASGSNYYASFYNEAMHDFDYKRSPMSERHSKLNEAGIRLREARQKALNLDGGLGEHYLEIAGDMAIIRFDSFVMARLPSSQSEDFYAQYVDRDVFSLFYTSYKKIEEAGGVKNVIIDLSCNGGGNANAMIEALGFILDNPSFYLYDNASKTSFVGSYRTDCNADGKFEEGESPASKYTHYLLTSEYSFSCGNAFPHYAKESGIKTIGQRSGGGSCITLPIFLSDGYPIRISGPWSLGKKMAEDPSIDGGIAPDIEIPETDFYDASKLKEAISK